MTTIPQPQETTDHAGVRLPPPLLYGAVLALALLLQWLWPLPRGPQPLTAGLGLLLLAAGVGLAAGGIAAFRRAGTSLVPVQPATALVTAGPYRFTRNPMYLGLLGVYLGAGLLLNLLWAAALAPVVVGLVRRLVIVKEERYLTQKFGEVYRQYQARVRRWL